jgi:hypothetical protein
VSFDQAAVLALFSNLQTHAMELGLFETVNTHEAKNAPGAGVWCTIWVQRIRPTRSSGLAITSGYVEFTCRIGASFMAQPEDSIDPAVLTAASTLIGAYSGNITLGGTVRMIDLLGIDGTPLSALAGYVQIDRKVYRVMDITLPVIVNDMWAQVQ